MSWLPALLGGAASFIGGERANAARQRQSREAMAFSERMRDTQFQASARDLEKAGLNRILALGSPAAAPQGLQAQIQDTISPAVTSAFESSKTIVGNELTKANTVLKNTENLLKKTGLSEARSKEIIADQVLRALEATESLIETKGPKAIETTKNLFKKSKELLRRGAQNDLEIKQRILKSIQKKYGNNKAKLKRMLKQFKNLLIPAAIKAAPKRTAAQNLKEK